MPSYGDVPIRSAQNIAIAKHDDTVVLTIRLDGEGSFVVQVPEANFRRFLAQANALLPL